MRGWQAAFIIKKGPKDKKWIIGMTVYWINRQDGLRVGVVYACEGEEDACDGTLQILQKWKPTFNTQKHSYASKAHACLPTLISHFHCQYFIIASFQKKKNLKCTRNGQHSNSLYKILPMLDFRN